MAPSNADCNDLYKEAKKFLLAAHKARAKLEEHLLAIVQTKSRQESLLSPTNVGKLRTLHDDGPVFNDVRHTLEKIAKFENRFIAIAKDEKSLRKTLFYRCRHLVSQLERCKLSLLYLVQRWVTTLLQMVAARNVTVAQAQADWIFALQCIDAFNKLLSDFYQQPGSSSRFTCDSSTSLSGLAGAGDAGDEADCVHTLLHGVRNRGAHLHENFSPTYHVHLKQMSSSRILTLLSSERAWLAALEITKSVVVGIDRKSLEQAGADVSWLSLPGDNRANPPEPSQVYHSQSSSSKTRRKSEQASPTSDYHSQNGSGASGGSHMAIIEDFVANEEVMLNAFFSLLSQVPGLLNKNVLKSTVSSSKSSSGGGERIARAARLKMSEFYHDHLWQHVGSMAQKTLLWGELQGYVYIPYGLQHPRFCQGLSNMIQDNLYAKFGDGYPPIVFPSMHLLVEALNLHTISVSWDIQYMQCLAESVRAKNHTVPVNTMPSGTTASKTGQLFYDTIKSVVRLNNTCHPDMIRDFVEHGTHDPEEFPFLEELHALRRLLITLQSLRNWCSTRAYATLHAWQVRDFFLITQVDLFNLLECFHILQLESHERNATTKSINIQLFTHVQGVVCTHIREYQAKIKSLPMENQSSMSSFCKMFSLATLQNVFPGDSYWRQSGHGQPKAPSAYVQEYINRVLCPVFGSLHDMSVDIQQTMARIAIKAFCEAWLEHIKSSKIRFSTYGAHQISLDFQLLRNWVGSNTSMKDDARRYLLLLDSLRQCEGVAKLLLAKPGELVSVKPAKNRIVPLSGEPEEQSPVHQILDAIPAELYVPDQQSWIELKAGSKVMGLPFCCR